MRSSSFLMTALILFIALSRPDVANATAIANTEIFLTLRIILPPGVSMSFVTPLTAKAFADATNATSQSVITPNGVAKADAGKIADNFAEGHGFASAVNIANLNASASSHANIPGTTTAQALAKGTADIFSDDFIIIGGSGLAAVTFSADLSGSLDIFTDSFRGKAIADAIFALDVNGSSVLFDFEKLPLVEQLSVDGLNSSDEMVFSKNLVGTVMLPFNEHSSFFANLVTDLETDNQISEPSTVILMLSGLITLAFSGRRKV